jgi:hypothetical protein
MGILTHPAAAAAGGRPGRVCRLNRFDFVPHSIAFFSRHQRFYARWYSDRILRELFGVAQHAELFQRFGVLAGAVGFQKDGRRARS